jgi:hypothetical protein
MRYSNLCKMACMVVGIGLLNGCGTYVPEIQDFYEPFDALDLVNAIVRHVECEVQTSVQEIILDDMRTAAQQEPQGRRLSWLDTWGAQIVLTLTIEEKSSFNPGLSLNTPIHNGITNFVGETLPGSYPASLTSYVAGNTFSALTTSQSYVLGFGGNFSSDATRTETLSFFIDFTTFTDKENLKRANEVLKPAKEQFGAAFDPTSLCQQKGFLIQSDLKLRNWLQLAVSNSYEDADFSQQIKSTKKDAIAHEVKFMIIYGGNVSPSWKLVRVSANQGSPLFGATRSKTQDLLITLTPPNPTGQLSAAANNTVLASQIGQAVASAINRP